MKLSFFDKHPSKKAMTSSFNLTPTPSLVDSHEDDDGSMSDDETIAVSNVSSPLHHVEEQDSPTSLHQMTTFLTFPSNWGSIFLCGSLQVGYYVDS